MQTGEKLWTTQTLKGDAYNMGCEIPGIRRMVCPKKKVRTLILEPLLFSQ